MLTHTLHEAIRSPRSPLRVLVVGAGGNGSKLTVGMKNLHGALLALGHPGVQLTLADGDTVSTSNLVRQSFFPSDVGLNKATVLINRINTSCGLAWEAVPHHLTAYDLGYTRIDLLASCVDSRAARREVADGLKDVVNTSSTTWISATCATAVRSSSGLPWVTTTGAQRTGCERPSSCFRS